MLLIMKFWGWKRVSMALVLIIHFLEPISMLLPKRVCKHLKFVSIKFVYSYIQKCITWPRKSRKGKQEWKKACIESKIQPKKLNTFVKTW